MDLHLLREELTEHNTLGRLFINGDWKWWTLEDCLRWDGPKVPGETCIPAGKYKVAVTFSERFQRSLPLLIGVPNFTGIRIHPGNTDKDTAGCILVGGGRIETADGFGIGHSAYACAQLQGEIREAINRGEAVWITIEDPIRPHLSPAINANEPTH